MHALQTWGISDAGLVRDTNEDRWLVEPSLGLAMVADGMGGTACGEVAAALAIESVIEYMRWPGREGEPLALLQEAIRHAHQRVRQEAESRPQCRGMGTTLVAALWRLPHIYFANVGDSRAYLFRDSRLIQLSYDQTLLNELRVKFGLSHEQVAKLPYQHVLTMAVGAGEQIIIHTQCETLRPGDQVLLCSDGLSGPVPEQQIAAILAGADPLPDKAARLLEAARAHGAPDNVTAVLLCYASPSAQ